jgi:tetratricopeptide (TPR) repeat protein
MRITRISSAALIVFMLLAAAAAAGWTRQEDPRLEVLFGDLHAATDPGRIGLIEGTIWQVWGESGKPTVDLFYARGVQAMSTRNLDDALELFDTIVELDPEFAEGWNKRATVYFLMGEYAASIADVERTLALEPRHFGALSGLGMIYLRLDDPAGALDAFSRAIAVHPHLRGARAEIKRLEEIVEGQGI